MLWKTEFETELTQVFRDAERLIDAFPAPLNAKGRAYLHAFNPLNPSAKKNHICYLLPFWMRPVADLEAERYRQLSLANVFVMLYFFIQDDLMDEAPADWKEQLALGNLFHLAMLDLYRALFEHASPFWRYYRDYVTAWSLAVAYESPSGSLIPGELARKAAPVKLASTGALLLAGRAELEPAVSEAVDLTLATLQMADDWSDWEEDFDRRNANGLVGMIEAEHRAAGLRPPLGKHAIQAAIHVDGALGRYAQAAKANGDALVGLGLPLRHLSAFHDYLADGLSASAERLSDTKKRLLGGGFAYWLSQYQAETADNKPD
ncbi:hypothetical protein I8J29_04020 [Paenibacillus sp. MWE-103]|uniref:Polyprenyl synthetase n=1 Tax=Paenibacillus artemisiicola TaxID=1172618 RepID=A0ABS3W4V7_9BACL|nr:hypothetical protein [Paenibacillus artemisiicola]MBO7743347.1 hypothetical protein [Paenibacillus artemisiicola]